MNNHYDMRDILDKVSQIEAQSENKKLNEFFESVAASGNMFIFEGIVDDELIQEGIFGKFGDWVKNALTKPNVNPDQIAKIEADASEKIINKYEAVPADKVRWVIPVNSLEDLKRIAGKGPDEEDMKLAKLVTSKGVLKPSDYKVVKGYKFAVLSDIPRATWEKAKSTSLVDIGTATVKKGVWGALRLTGKSFEEMIPADVLGMKPIKKKAKPKAEKTDTESAQKAEAPKQDVASDVGSSVADIAAHVSSLLKAKKLTNRDVGKLIIELGKINKKPAATQDAPEPTE